MGDVTQMKKRRIYFLLFGCLVLGTAAGVRVETGQGYVDPIVRPLAAKGDATPTQRTLEVRDANEAAPLNLSSGASGALAAPDSSLKLGESMRANSLYVLHPYKVGGSWVFDDESVGLKMEPFVLGIDDMIERMVTHLPDAAKGFRLLFSPQPFPGYAAKLEWRREDAGGNWYFSPTFGFEGWLCPALFKYFDSAPKELYAKAEPLKR